MNLFVLICDCLTRLREGPALGIIQVVLNTVLFLLKSLFIFFELFLDSSNGYFLVFFFF